MMRKYKDDCRYFNFPITLLKDFLNNSKSCFHDVWCYALYVRAKEYTHLNTKHEKIQEALHFFSVKYTHPTNKLLNETYDEGNKEVVPKKRP